MPMMAAAMMMNLRLRMVSHASESVVSETCERPEDEARGSSESVRGFSIEPGVIELSLLVCPCFRAFPTSAETGYQRGTELCRRSHLRVRWKTQTGDGRARDEGRCSAIIKSGIDDKYGQA